MKAKSRVGGRRKRSSELLCGGSHLGSGSKRRPVSKPGVIYYKPVSRVFADHDPDREGFLHACAFVRTDFLSMTHVEVLFVSRRVIV